MSGVKNIVLYWKMQRETAIFQHGIRTNTKMVRMIWSCILRTDKKPYEQYVDIKRKVNEVHGTEHAAEQVVIFGNPCTMQIIIEHWDEIMLESHKKKKNAPIIFNLTGVENYKGRSDQRHELFSKITKENYMDMQERIKRLPSDDTVKCSSNFGDFMDKFTSDDTGWIKEINDMIEG